MKRALTTGYTFTPSTKTLDFSTTSGFNARYLVAVVNVTQKVMIYGVGITGKGYTTLTGGNVFVLQYDTTSHSSGDILYIIYDDIGGDATNGLDVDVTRMAALVAGSAIIGKVGIDQTTPGTTNAVAATNLPTTVDTNSGNKSASTLRMVLATDQPALTNALSVTDTRLPAALGQTTLSGGLAVSPPSDYNQPVKAVTAAPTVTSVTANNSDMVASTSAVGYQSATVQLTSVGGGATVSLQVSNDNSTWFTLTYNTTGANGAVLASAMTATNVLYEFVIPPSLFIRMRTTAYTSGTISGVLALSSLPIARTTYVVTPQSSNGNTLTRIPADGATNSIQALQVDGDLSLFNGSTWDRARNVSAVSVLTSAARTTTQTGSDTTNYNWRGLILYVNVTSAGTGSITPSLDIKDSVSATYKTIWTAAAAITSNGIYVYALTIGAADAASFTENKQIMLGRTFRVNITANNANSITYSVSYDLLPF